MEQRVELATKFLNLVRTNLQEGSKYEEFLRTMKAFKEQKMETEAVCSKLQTLFSSHRHLIQELNRLIPSQFKSTARPRQHYAAAMDYMQKVKEETKTRPELYERFIKVLKDYQEKRISLEEVDAKVKEVLAGFPGLIENFKPFLPNYYESSDEEAEDSERPHKVRKPPLQIDKVLVSDLSDPIGTNEINFFRRLRRVLDLNSLPSSNFFFELASSFDLYTECVITKQELFDLVGPLFRVYNAINFVEASYSRKIAKEDPQLIEMVSAKMASMFETFKGICGTRESSRRKHGMFFKSLSDFDTSSNNRDGHSYTEMQRPRIKQQRPSSLINRQWISVPHGSEDVSFRHFRKNGYEDALFKCEDDRFEMDITIESAKYMLGMLEDVQRKLNDMTPEQQLSYKIEDSVISPFRLKSIHSIYGEHAASIINILENTPSKALPVIIVRLKSKIEWWEYNCKVEMEKTWGETIEKNFTKSLDHRSFYFKQNEKKVTNSKAFLAEAKERYSNVEKNKQKLRESSSEGGYEYLGGSFNRYFFNSFSGLSNSAVPHKVPQDFEDELLEDFKNVDDPSFVPSFANAPVHATLPQYRLLLRDYSVLTDSIRILLFSVEKLNLGEKLKLNKWLVSIFQDFMGITLPQDVLNSKVEDFFENIVEEEVKESEREKEGEEEITRNIIEKWINNNCQISEPAESDSRSMTDLAQDPLNLKTDLSFARYLPLRRSHLLMYCPSSVFVFLRHFYTVYERLLFMKIALSGSNTEDFGFMEKGEYSFSDLVEGEYLGLLKSLCSVIKNSCENGKFEEKCRCLLKRDAYIYFSFDKVVAGAVKALIGVAQEDVSQKSLSLFFNFSRHHLNEEMYLAEFLSSSGNSPSFRLHWNKHCGILSITLVDFSPEDPQTSNYALKYIKGFGKGSKSVTDLEKDLGTMFRRLDSYYASDSVGLENLEKQLFSKQEISIGLGDHQRKIQYTRDKEDVFLNMKYYSGRPVLEEGKDRSCTSDKNSFIQKIVEDSEEKLNKKMEEE